MNTDDHYDTNPPGTDRFKTKKCFHHSKTHWCMVDQNLPQLKTPARIKIYNWWNTVIRSEKLHFMYLSTESTILLPGTKTFNIKGGIFFIESKTVDTALQDSVAASKA